MMNPALTISGAISTPLARRRFFWIQVISGSRTKFDSVVCALATSACCSDCAWAAGATNIETTAAAKPMPPKRCSLRNIWFSLMILGTVIKGGAPSDAAAAAETWSLLRNTGSSRRLAAIHRPQWNHNSMGAGRLRESRQHELQPSRSRGEIQRQIHRVARVHWEDERATRARPGVPSLGDAKIELERPAVAAEIDYSGAVVDLRMHDLHFEPVHAQSRHSVHAALSATLATVIISG